MKKRRIKKKVWLTIGLLGIYLGYLLLVWPYICDHYARIFQTSWLAAYDDHLNDIDDNKLDEIKDRCQKYNEMIYLQQQESQYRYSSALSYDQDYLALPWKDEKVLAAIIIPKIKVNLPIGHGTADDTLQVMAGHLYGTSLPSGGKDTHAVVAAHSGLRSSELFSRLDELRIDDEVQIKIFDEIHSYKVEQIKVVLPDECDQYLQIIPNEDLITLYTCTPYGINSHRLLIRAKRSYENDKKLVNNIRLENSRWKHISAIGSIILLPFGGMLIFITRKRRMNDA